MNDITNTSKLAKEEPDLLLDEALLFGSSNAIERQEARGQQELVASTLLPTEILHSTQTEFEALGFVFGDVVEGDPLFRQVQLPEGWTKEGTDHSMCSTVNDERGIERVSVFYKAAFYDRSAHMTLSNVGYKTAQDFICGDEEIFTPHPELTDSEKANAVQSALEYLGDAEMYPDIYDKGDRARIVVDTLSAAS